jgi:pimeloyl-ACP methyl ester carboxylesterase
MSDVRHRTVETNGIRMHVAEQGEGPLVLLCHGFPESWYSWRHQLTALAAAGFHAVAPDMRGYGQTDQPTEIDQYTLLHLVGDMVGLVDALGEGAAVIGLSVPYRPRGTVRPTTAMPQTDEAIFYQLYFQAPGVAEAELSRDVRSSIRRILFSGSGEGRRASAGLGNPAAVGMVPRVGGFLNHTAEPSEPPAWLTEADVDFYAGEFSRAGFRGGLNWYRNIDRNWELMAPYAGARVTVPALYVAGDQDLVVHFRGMDQLLPNLKRFVPELRQTIMLPGCGHWTQQERPKEVNDAIIAFLATL